MSQSVSRVIFVLWRGGQWTEVEAMGLKGRPEPTIPRKGDLIKGPDEFGYFVVDNVLYDYADGFAQPPEVHVRCTPRGDS
jgi:hypothetical protein